MTFYIFDALSVPIYPEEQSFGGLNNREVSFNVSESFFQIPPSLKDEEEDGENNMIVELERQESTEVFYVPETQYTPLEAVEQNILVDVTADQSILLPSISSVLEASVRSAQNYRRKSNGGPPFNFLKKASIAIDRLELPSQNPNSPLLYGSTKASESALDLSEDSLLMALNSSVILCDDKVKGNENGENQEKYPKFSLDFLNTPPLGHENNAFNDKNDSKERIPTQVLIQNLGGEDTQMDVNHDISLLSIDDSSNHNHFDFVPNTPNVLEGHDAIYFPDSFDETNNPFLCTNPNDKKQQLQPELEPIDENINDSSNNISIGPNSGLSFQARLLSTSPINLNLKDYALKKGGMTSKAMCPLKPAPLSIKPTSASFSKSISNESLQVADPIKKSLGARLKRTHPVTTTPSKAVGNSVASPSVHEEKYINHILKTENKRISTIIAEPRKTPIAGIKISASLSQSISASGTPTKIVKTPSNLNLIKEAHISSFYSDEALSSPYPSSAVAASPAVSEGLPVISIDGSGNLYFKENQWVFFKNPQSSGYTVGSVTSKASKTRDTWRIKQSNGAEYTVSSQDMCPVAFLRSFDEFKIRQRKDGKQSIQTPSFSFKFYRFNPKNNVMLETHNEQPDFQLKLTRISIDRETFLKLRDRFEHGCIEDSQIREQIMMTFNSTEASTPVATVNSKRKKRLINASETHPIPTPSKRSRQQQIFLGIKFLITVGDNTEDTALKEKYSRLIESHGGELLTNLSTDHEVPVLKTYLLSNGFKRTQKYMIAIIRGVPRVHFNWIEACCTQACFIDPTNFSTFLLEPPIGCKATGLIFKNKKFYLSGAAKFKNSWVSVIRLLGGTVSNSPSANTIVLTEDMKTVATKGPVEKVVNVDWLINCITEKSFK